ncbi:MAG: hypothetical protein ISQ52_10150 [Synechococcus sp. BS307-5m-G38]|nr:hypothetical protein [Synechococcus sp. BS307-5m-G38]
MDGDFQLQYQAAERAYGAGDYPEARRLASELLSQLSDQPQDPDTQAAVLGWRAFVALLLGHIDLHGLEHPAGAIGFYQQVLDSQPQETLAELAQQGLERCQLAITAPGAAVAADSPSPESSSLDSPASKPETAVVRQRQELPELLRDPFLTQQPAETTGPGQPTDDNKPAATGKTTAMPWLDASPAAARSEPEPGSEPVTAAESTPTPTQTPTPTPASTSTTTPQSTSTTDPQAEPQPTPTPTPEHLQEPATESRQKSSPAAISSAALDPAAVLKGSLLRVTIQPAQISKSEATPLDRRADSLLMRLWQRLSRRR